MKEFQDIAAWFGSFKTTEAPYPALSEWLELESRRAKRRERAMVGKVFAWILGLIVLYTGVVLVLEGMYRWETQRAFFLQMLLGSAIAAAPLAVAASVMRRTFEKRAAASIDPEVARAVSTLRSMRTPRRLARKLGKNGAVELNEGAVLYFRCRMALWSDAWNSQAPTEPWGEARLAMLSAMEAAMGRLALCIVKQRSFTEIGPIFRRDAGGDQRGSAGYRIARLDGRKRRPGFAGFDASDAGIGKNGGRSAG